jgi:hypothetical protein
MPKFVVTVQTTAETETNIDAMRLVQERLNLLHEFSLSQMTGKEVLDILSKTFKFSVIDAREI